MSDDDLIKNLRSQAQLLTMPERGLMLAAADRLEILARLDREAATHVESVIVMRTGFTGQPPYVGWEGLGRTLSEALDHRDQLIEQAVRDGQDILQARKALGETIRDRELFREALIEIFRHCRNAGLPNEIVADRVVERIEECVVGVLGDKPSKEDLPNDGAP